MLLLLKLAACIGFPNGSEAWDDPPGSDWVQVRASNHNGTCGRRTDGSLSCWGFDVSYGLAPPLGTFTDFDVYGGICGVTEEGAVSCTEPPSTWISPDGTPFVEVAVGQFVCARTQGGVLRCDGSEAPFDTTEGAFVHVAAGGDKVCGLRADGSLTCWKDGTREDPDGLYTTVDVARPGTRYPTRPAIEDMLPPVAHGFSRFYRTVLLIAKQAIGAMTKKPSQLEALDTTRAQRTSRFQHIVVPEETLKRLTESCREKGTTVGGALVAAMLTAMARKINPSEKVTLGCVSPVDVRGQLSPPLGDEVGMLACGVITTHTVEPGDDFWRVAKEFQSAVANGIESGEVFVTLGLVGSMLPKTARPEAFADKMTNTLKYASTLTNLGVVTIPNTYGPLTLTDIHFAVSLRAFTGREFDLAVTSFQGKIFLNFLHTAPSLSDEVARDLAQQVIAILEEHSGAARKEAAR